MPFELDDKVDLSRARDITLAGRALKVPPQMLREKIAASVLLSKLAAREPEERLNAMVDYLLVGLSRAYPRLTRDDILDSEISSEELAAAADVIIVQSGGRKAEEAGDAAAGEA